MKEKIGKLLGMICLVGLLTANVSVFALHDLKEVPPEGEVEDESGGGGDGGPQWDGFELDADKACCYRRYHEDQCAAAWGAC